MTAPQAARPHSSNLAEALSIIGDARHEDVLLERSADGRLCWRGGGKLSKKLRDRIRANEPALLELLGHCVLAFEQRAILHMSVGYLELDDAFGLAASELGMAGGTEYGRQIAGR